MNQNYKPFNECKISNIKPFYKFINKLIKLERDYNVRQFKKEFRNYANFYFGGTLLDEIGKEEINSLKESFDILCRIADFYSKKGNIEEASTLISLFIDSPINFGGPVQEFYRKHLDYHPKSIYLN